MSFLPFIDPESREIVFLTDGKGDSFECKDQLRYVPRPNETLSSVEYSIELLDTIFSDAKKVYEDDPCLHEYCHDNCHDDCYSQDYVREAVQEAEQPLKDKINELEERLQELDELGELREKIKKLEALVEEYEEQNQQLVLREETIKTWMSCHMIEWRRRVPDVYV